MNNGIIAVFLENISYFYWTDGRFESPHDSMGFYTTGYDLSRPFIPTDDLKSRWKKKDHDNIIAAHLSFFLLGERKKFIIYGTMKELCALRKTLQQSFESGTPFVTRTYVEKGENLGNGWEQIEWEN